MIENFDRGVIKGIGFARPDDLHRVFRVVEHCTKQLDVARDQIGTLVSGKAAGPNDGQHIGLEKLAGLIGHHAEESFLELAFAVSKFFDRAALTRVLHAVIGPILFVLRVGDMGDFADVRIVLPHLARNFAMKFGNAVGDARQTQCGKRMVELFAFDAGDLADFVFGNAAEESKVPEQIEFVTLVARFFGSVRGEDQSPFHFFQAVVLCIKVKRGGEPVCFVEVPDFGIDAEFIEQFRSARTENDVLSDAAAVILIVKAVRDLA